MMTKLEAMQVLTNLIGEDVEIIIDKYKSDEAVSVAITGYDLDYIVTLLAGGDAQ